MKLVQTLTPDFNTREAFFAKREFFFLTEGISPGLFLNIFSDEKVWHCRTIIGSFLKPIEQELDNSLTIL